MDEDYEDDYEEEDFEDFDGSTPGTATTFEKPPGTPATKSSVKVRKSASQETEEAVSSPSKQGGADAADVAGLDLEKYMADMKLKSATGDDGEVDEDLAEELAAELRPLDGVRPDIQDAGDERQEELRKRLGYVNSPSPAKEPTSSKYSNNTNGALKLNAHSPGGVNSEHPSTKSSKASADSSAENIEQHLLNIHRSDYDSGLVGSSNGHVSFAEQASLITAAVEASSAKNGVKKKPKKSPQKAQTEESDTLALANAILERHEQTQLKASPKGHSAADNEEEEEGEEEEEEDEEEEESAAHRYSFQQNNTQHHASHSHHSSDHHNNNGVQKSALKKVKTKAKQQHTSVDEIERANAQKVDALLMELFPERYAQQPPVKGKKGAAAASKAKKASHSKAAAGGGGVGYSKHQQYGLGARVPSESATDAAYRALLASQSEASIHSSNEYLSPSRDGGAAGAALSPAAALGALDQELRLLRKELKVKDEKVRKVTDHAIMMGTHMDKMKGEIAMLTSKLREAHLEIESQGSRLHEALKHRKKVVVRKVALPPEEHPDFAALTADNQRLRDREQALMDAIEELSRQNEDLIDKLKESMERELDLSSKRSAAISNNVSNLHDHHLPPVRTHSEPVDGSSKVTVAGAAQHHPRKTTRKKK